MLKIHKKPFIQDITERWMLDKGLQLFIKREDVIHPFVSGNKWRKLKYNLEEAKRQGHNKLLTFGGAYSNHIYAVAAAANEADFESIGVIRGEELAKKPLNKTLSFAKDQGMRLHFVSRADYRNKAKEEFTNKLKDQFGPFYLLPEGGTNMLAVKGTAEILDADTEGFDFITAAVGTGGTLAGIASASQAHQKTIGFSALKGEFLTQEIQSLLQAYGTDKTNWQINNEYHCGGYAKTPEYLMQFIEGFERRHRVLLDPIYTGKMMYGLYDLLNKGAFKSGSKILTIHTGGLQGRME